MHEVIHPKRVVGSGKSLQKTLNCYNSELLCASASSAPAQPTPGPVRFLPWVPCRGDRPGWPHLKEEHTTTRQSRPPHKQDSGPDGQSFACIVAEEMQHIYPLTCIPCMIRHSYFWRSEEGCVCVCRGMCKLCADSPPVCQLTEEEGMYICVASSLCIC